MSFSLSHTHTWAGLLWLVKLPWA